MRITINYEASWQNSFLDGSNNEPVPAGGRKFCGSMTTLSKRDAHSQYPHFIECPITQNTIMGVLNRLIGDQRKLYQSKQNEGYFFSGLESLITFSNEQYKSIKSKEVVYIRNITGSTDQNSFTGMILNSDPMFTSDCSNKFWGVLNLDFENLCAFIIDENFIVPDDVEFTPLSTIAKVEELKKLKDVKSIFSKTKQVENIAKALSVLQDEFPDVQYLDNNNSGVIKPIMFYCSSLYLQVKRLSKNFDLSNFITKNMAIKGFSKRGFTEKDFMVHLTTGSKKRVWGNPYILKEKRQGDGEVVSMLTKASGVLVINLNIDQEKAKKLAQMIDAAGVSSFYLGKKGLAYVSDIRL